MSGLWCVNVGYGRARAGGRGARTDARAAVLQQLLPEHDPPAIELARSWRSDAAAVQPRVLHGLGLRGERHRSCGWCAATGTCMGQPERKVIISRDERLSRQHDGRGEPRRHGVHARAGRPADPRTSCTSSSPTGSANGGDLSPEEFGLRAARALEEKILELGADTGRGIHRRAGAGRRRRDHSAGDLLARDPAHLRASTGSCWWRTRSSAASAAPATGSAASTSASRPDFMTIAKGMSSGYLPIGGVMVGDRVAEVLIDKGGEFAHGFTYSGHPVACAVAIANLQHHPAREARRAGARRAGALPRRALARAGRASAGRRGALHRACSARSSWSADKASRRFFDKRGEVGHDLPRPLLRERPDHARRARHHDRRAAAGHQPGSSSTNWLRRPGAAST